MLSEVRRLFDRAVATPSLVERWRAVAGAAAADAKEAHRSLPRSLLVGIESRESRRLIAINDDECESERHRCCF